MKLFKYLISLAIVVNLSIYGQGITIGSGTTFIGGSADISLSGNWNNSGTFTPGSSTVIFSGPSGNQTITNSGGETFNNLTVNKAADDVILASNITVNGNLTVTIGDLDLNGNVATLGVSALLSETAGNTVKGTSGVITTTRSINAPSNNNVGGLGAILTTTSDLGTTVIDRGHTMQSGGGNDGIFRYFNITPTANSGLNATLIFCYDESELNSIPESDLGLFRSEDGGTNWTKENGNCNTSTNQIELTGIDAFSRWTAGGNSNPLPVELTTFTANIIEKTVELNWETATEVNNYGFEIERHASASLSMNGNIIPSVDDGWNVIGFVNGHGNSNSPKYYSFEDDSFEKAGKYSYRLKQIDIDGSYEYSHEVNVEIEIEVIIPDKFVLEQNYPNPFNPSTIIEYSLPEQTKVKLRIIDILGNEVFELVNATQSAGYYQYTFNASKLASGIYIYQLSTKNGVVTKKMEFLK